MKKGVMVLGQTLIIASLLISGLRAQEFKTDPGKTVLNWEGKGVGKAHNGTIGLKSGTVVFKSGIPAEGMFVFDMTSIVNKDLDENMADRLVGHLKSDDFFSVEIYPEAVFKVVGAHALDAGKLHLIGELTIKGKTHPIEFMADVLTSGNTYRFLGKVEVDRSLYDVKYGSGKFFENLGDKAISDIFTLGFDLYFNTPE